MEIIGNFLLVFKIGKNFYSKNSFLSIKTYDLQDIKDVESIMSLDDVNQQNLYQLG